MEGQMERRAKFRGLLALVSTLNDGKKRMEFVNRDFHAVINVRCAVMEKRPPDWTRENFVGQPLKVELYEKKLEAVVGGRSKKLGGVCTSGGDDLSKARSPPLLNTVGGRASHRRRPCELQPSIHSFLTSFISAGDYDTARCVNEVYQLFLSFQYIVLTLRTKCLSLLYTQRVGWLEFVRVLALAACALVVMCSGERP